MQRKSEENAVNCLKFIFVMAPETGFYPHFTCMFSLFAWRIYIMNMGCFSNEETKGNFLFKKANSPTEIELISSSQQSKGNLILRKSTLNIQWKDWCWSSNILATWCEELTHWKRYSCWKKLKAREEGDDRGWDGWMASLTQWIWVWGNSGRQWLTEKPGVLQVMGLQRVRHDLVTEQH